MGKRRGKHHLRNKPKTETITVNEALQRAITLLQSGQPNSALRILNSILDSIPSQFDALQLSGVAEAQLGRLNLAVERYNSALKINNDQPAVHNNLGKVLNDLKQHEEAAQSIRRALDLKPDYAEAYNNLGIALLGLNRPEEALQSYRRAIDLKPDSPQLQNNLGVALKDLERHEEAILCYRRALDLKPDYPEAHNNLGIVLKNLQRCEDAIQSYKRALDLKPDYLEVYNNLGNALLELKRHEEAIQSYRRAIELKPDYPEAYNNLGNTLLDLKRHEEAIQSYRRALELNPDYPEAYNNLGNALRALKRHEEAIDCFERALDLRPNFTNAISNLAEQKQYICDWSDFYKIATRIQEIIKLHKGAIQPFMYLDFSDNANEIFDASKKYCEEKTRVVQRLPRLNVRPPYGPITLAYISADLRDHAVGFQMAELFELHDRDVFEVHVLNLGSPKSDATKNRVANAVNAIHEVQTKSDHEIVQLIGDLSVDIIVDLMGFTQDARLGVLARKAAPIQVGYLGYPGTIGGDFLDYILADDFVAPLDHQQFFSEKLVLLPHSYQVNDSKRPIIVEPPSRIGLGLPEDAFVFCCFNTSRKITPSVFDVWMRLLEQCPKSVLWLVSDNNSATENLKEEARRRGVDPERLIFAPRVPLEEHITRQAAADLFVDTFPYPAHGTGSHALWAGLPLLTCVGNSFHSRVSGSLLRAVGLPELITTSLEDYEALALKLAGDPDLLVSYRKRLTDNRTTAPLFDCKRFTRNLEAAYQQMWQRWQMGKPPEAFSIVEQN